VGKTTTTASVGSILASQGKQVLVIDLDAQANLTASLLHGESDVSIYNALVGNESLPVVDISPNLHLVPASLGLAMADLELASAMARERILAELIDEVKDNYDYILIDCPPSLGLLTLNAFTASNEIIIPLVAEVLPFKGLTMINNFIDMVRKRLNPKAHVTGILITRWENTNLSKQIEKGMRAQLGELVFQTKIRKNVTIAEAPLESKNIVEYAPRSNGAKDYKAFTEELLKMFGE
jgi:chromosome partitioning protein